MAELFSFPKVEFVGNKSLQAGDGFHYYNADEVVAGKKMSEWLKFSVAYWHTMDQRLVDPFGEGTATRPWDKEGEEGSMALALAKVDYMFEF